MIKTFIQRFKRRQAEPTFTETLSEIESFKTLVAKSRCPGCTQQTLKVSKFTKTKQGWDVAVFCTNCPSLKGVVNSNGFSFEGLEKDGKAKT